MGITDYISEIEKAKEVIANNFYDIGKYLKLLKNEIEGISEFRELLNDPRLDFNSKQASHLIKLTAKDEYKELLSIGINKLLEIMKLEPGQQKIFLAKFKKDKKKALKEVSFYQLKQIIKELKLKGKIRCDRCKKLVETAKEIDGKFYGSAGRHSCYDKEMEERRGLLEGQIPAPVLDNVLSVLKKERYTKITNKMDSTLRHFDRLSASHTSTSSVTECIAGSPTKEDELPVNWLPDSFYRLYAQLLKETDNKNISSSILKNEVNAISKLVKLLKTRMTDVQTALTCMDSTSSLTMKNVSKK